MQPTRETTLQHVQRVADVQTRGPNDRDLGLFERFFNVKLGTQATFGTVINDSWVSEGSSTQPVSGQGFKGMEAALQEMQLSGLLEALQGLSSAEVAEILGVELSNLARLVQSVERIPAPVSRRMHLLVRLVRGLRQLVPVEATGRWFQLSIPGLNETSPIEAIRQGRIEQVVRLAESYSDPSFG